MASMVVVALQSVLYCCMLQSSTFKVNIRFSNVASELLIWVSQTASHVPCDVVVCLYVNMHVSVCCGHVVTWSRGHGQDQVEKQWWALRFGPGASGFIIDGALLKRNHRNHRPNLIKASCWLQASAMPQCRAWPTCSIDTPQVRNKRSAY